MGSSNQIKFLASLTAMALAFPIQSHAGEWKQAGNGWKYLENGFEQRNSWLKTNDGKWYHFDENGMMGTGWYRDGGGKWYYLDADGAMASGWREVGGKWYYLEESGAMAVGWKQIDGKWYYQDKNSGETMMHGYTPDGYYVDGSGAWNGGSAHSSDNWEDDGESGQREQQGNSPGQNTGSGNTGSGSNGSGNTGSENNGSGNTDQGGDNPWESSNPVILEQTGIVSVQGFPFAVVTFSGKVKGKEGFRYSISGKDATASVTPVTTSGDTIKIPLPDKTPRTLLITSGNQTVSVISLAEPGNSSKADKEVAESGISIPADMPAVALTKAVIPLSQYVKFIRQGEEIFVKSPATTVDGVQDQMRSDNREEESISEITVREDNLQGISERASDAVASATAAPPASMEGKEKTAVIAVQFDMAANYVIAGEIGIEGAYGTAFINKWKDLEKVSALNKDFTLSTDLNNLGERSWKKAEDLPKYVKYLTAQGGMGTKVQLLNGKTDSTSPPELTISPSLKGESAVLELGGENESWYRSITEIAVPYSFAKTHYYQENNTLSEDGKRISLNVDALSGPMNLVGTYEVTIKSFGFDDVTGTLNVVEQAPGFTPTWDAANSYLKLRADFSYYTDRVRTVIVNGKQLETGKFTGDVNSLYIPYGYLSGGNNTFEIKADGYADAAFDIKAPDGFVTPDKAAEVDLEMALAGTSEINFRVDAGTPGSGEAQWFQVLEAEHVKLTYGKYGTVSVSSLIKTEDGFTVGTGNTSLSASNEYTLQISVPGYEVVKIVFTPVNAAPALEQKWDENSFSLKLTGSSNSYLSSYVARVVLNGKELTKGEIADYAVSYSSGMEIFPHNFTPGSSYRIELYAPQYTVNILEGTVPENLTVPLEAPSIAADSVPKGSGVVVRPLEEAGSWLDEVSRVTVRSSYASAGTETAYVKSENGLLIKPDNFYSAGIYTIMVEAAGYRTAQTTVKILNTVEVTGRMNYDEERLELTADAYYYYDKTVVYLNGTELRKGEDYTVGSSSRTAYISAALLMEEENKVVLENEDYQTAELSFDRYTAALSAPELEVDMEASAAGGNKIVLKISGGDEDWWAALGKTAISVKRLFDETVSGFTADPEAEQLTIGLNSKLTTSSSYDYTVTISVPGYRSCAVSFAPYEEMPEIEDEWLDNGDLKFTSGYGYFSSSSVIYLDGKKLAEDEDYRIVRSYAPVLTIFAERFTPGDHTVRIENRKYAPYEITVTAPELEKTLVLDKTALFEEVQNVKPEAVLAGEEISKEGILAEETIEEEVPLEESSESEEPLEDIAEEEEPEEDFTEEESPEGEAAEGEAAEGEAPAEENPKEETSEEEIPEAEISQEETPGEEIFKEQVSAEEN